MTKSSRANNDVLVKSMAAASINPKKLGGAGVVTSFPGCFLWYLTERNLSGGAGF